MIAPTGVEVVSDADFVTGQTVKLHDGNGTVLTDDGAEIVTVATRRRINLDGGGGFTRNGMVRVPRGILARDNLL